MGDSLRHVVYLKDARTARFLERRELASRAGINRRTIDRMEAGEEGGHRLSTIRKLGRPWGSTRRNW
jgi:DNA-binding XRE family transcriptional regulator